MYKENTIEFDSEKEHGKWVSDNRRTGLREIGCDQIDGVIKVTYIKLY